MHVSTEGTGNSEEEINKELESLIVVLKTEVVNKYNEIEKKIQEMK